MENYYDFNIQYIISTQIKEAYTEKQQNDNAQND